jgi:hypothetical protein
MLGLARACQQSAFNEVHGGIREATYELRAPKKLWDRLGGLDGYDSGLAA